MINVTQIVVALIGLLGTVITGFLIPWIMSKINIEKIKAEEGEMSAKVIALDILKQAVMTAVKAAEQLYNSDQGEQKKAYVISILESQGYTVDKGAVDAAIEAAVLELHRSLE